MPGCLFVVSGPSGAGKSSVVSRLRRPFHFSVSATTRDPRPGEVEGVHYRFIDRDAFLEMVEAGEFLEWAEYNNRLYGTPRDPVLDALANDQDVLLEIEVQGAAQIRARIDELPDLKCVMFFVIPPSIEELERRLRARGDTTEADIARRLAIAQEEISKSPGLFDYIVVNDDLDRCVAEVDHLMELHCPTTSQLVDLGDGQVG